MLKKLFSVCLFLAISLTAFSQASNTWSVKFSDAIISRYQPTVNTMTSKGWEYSNGIILHGMEKVYLQTNNAAYLNYIKAYVDAYVDANGNVTGLGTTVDKIQPGVLCLFLWEQTGQLKYKTAAINIKNYLLSTSPVNFNKTADGGYWHKNDGNYNNVMMVDGMYMLHPFLAHLAYVLNDNSLYDVATFQLLHLGSKAMPTPANLPKHAWDYSKTKAWANATTGLSTDVWSRGTGWYMMALADVLQYLPTTHPNYNAVLELFQRMSAGVAAKQDASGLWWQVVDKGTTSGNWKESSGSGMFVYALKKGIDNGWLSSSTYLPVCQLGWTGLQTRIGTYTDGKPQIQIFCVATGVGANTTAYFNLGQATCPTASGTQHPHGYCGILMAASEMEFPIATVAVTGVSVSPGSASLNLGATQQLTRTITPSNASNTNVTWSSNNTAVATVSSTGLVTAVGAGSATITVTTADGGFTATSSITVSVINVTGVSVTPTSASMAIGSTQQLTRTITPSNATNTNVTWASNNSAVATVSASGLVTAVSAGSATITVTTADGGFTATSAITSSVVNVSGVTVSPSTLSLGIGSTSTLTATVAPSNATTNTKTWSSSNTAIATVSASGVVTGVATGSATITATTTDGGFTSSCAVTVTSACTATGTITFERWNNISGTAVSTLTSNANYPNSPSSTSTRTSFEIPTNAANNYGCRVSGYICAPQTGAYTFWIAGDDNAELWLSTNSSASNKVKIAYHTGWTNSRQWTKFSTQKSAVINLVQGVTYYVEALMKEGSGSDNLAVGWAKPGQSTSAPSQVIPGSVLSPRNTPVARMAFDDEFSIPEEDDINIYPNPARDNVTILFSENLQSKEATISILSMNGRTVSERKNVLNMKETIDLTNLVSGMYIIRIRTNDEVITKRLSVVK